MAAGILLAISTLIQYGAAFLALRLTRITRQPLAWVLIASAIFLMAVRRSVSLVRLISDPGASVDPVAEAIALLISVLMFSGIAGIGPLFRSIESSREELRAGEARLRQIIDLVPHMIFAKDGEGRLLLANQAVAEAYGTTVERLIGTRHADLHAEGAELARMLADDQEVIRKGVSKFIPEETFVDAAGTQRILQTIKVPYHVSGGRETAVLGVAVDITERKAFERSLEQRSLELEHSNDELEQFAYVASHDLQAPLRAVVSFLQLLEAECAGQLSKAGREYLGFAVDGGKRMQALIQALLRYSRVGQGEPAHERVDLDELVEEVVQDLRPGIEASHAKVEWSGLPRVYAAPGPLRQILQNLLSNALRFRSAEAPQVRIRARRSGPFWAISVEDNGIGIDPDCHEQVFDVFRRLNPREDYPGTGVGLAIVKKLVERDGGSVELSSERGRGSTFTFTIPAREG